MEIEDERPRHLARLRHGIGSEDQPSATGDMVHQNDLHEGVHSVPQLADLVIGPDHEGMVDAEEGEGPCRPVPQAEQELSDQKGEEKGHAVARLHGEAAQPRVLLHIHVERRKDVIAEPARQRDVPAPPELADVLGKIGAAEILHQVDAHGLRQPDGHEGVAGEIAIDLEAERIDGKENAGAVVGRWRGEDGIDDRRQVVGDKDLEEYPPDEEIGPRVDFLEGHFARRQNLRQQAHAPFDGAGDELRKEGNVKSEIE